MHLRQLFQLALLVSSSLFAQTPKHTFTVSGNDFLMDGKPYQVLAGEMHYPRVPRAFWRDRLHKAKAMGLNTITTYAFWNVHEPTPGVYDFSGQNDIAEYIREAQQEGLNVILRPGPYVCAEWELGGYPSWLLKDKNLVLRSSDPAYTAAVRRWFTKLGEQMKPLMMKNGGPIIMVQVENEYGSFGDDRKYLEGVKDDLIASGMGDAVLYTSDGPPELPKDALPELPAVINFGSGDAEKSFAKFKEVRPEGPRMNGEYWAGWFDHWGSAHYAGDLPQQIAEYRWMIERGHSVNIYMFEGGTSFGWMNGANSNGKDYKPDTTSYDYNSPLDERGDPRETYFGFQKAIADVTHTSPAPPPSKTATATFPVSPKMLSASLWSNLPEPVESKALLTFEDLGQAYGYVLYRTDLKAGDGGTLLLDGLHDYAQIYIDQKLIGTLDRRLAQTSLEIPKQINAAKLDILVENTGRVNYTKVIQTERKGIAGSVMLGGKAPANWQVYSLPMSDLSKLQFNAGSCSGPCFYRTTMQVKTPADTYLDTRGAHKGMAWLGTQPLGRIWSIGPQFSLYTPGPWLHNGANPVTIFDLLGDEKEQLTTSAAPIFGPTSSKRD
jgi:beta-galactosidase